MLITFHLKSQSRKVGLLTRNKHIHFIHDSSTTYTSITKPVHLSSVRALVVTFETVYGPRIAMSRFVTILSSEIPKLLNCLIITH